MCARYQGLGIQRIKKERLLLRAYTLVRETKEGFRAELGISPGAQGQRAGHTLGGVTENLNSWSGEGSGTSVARAEAKK